MVYIEDVAGVVVRSYSGRVLHTSKTCLNISIYKWYIIPPYSTTQCISNHNNNNNYYYYYYI
jgi:hypothetical protein